MEATLWRTEIPTSSRLRSTRPVSGWRPLSTTLTERANPHRIAEDAKSKALAFVQQPPVKYTLAGLGVVVFLLVIRRFRRRY